MGARDMTEMKPLQEKATSAVLDELERQAAEKPDKLRVTRHGTTVTVNGELDVDGLVMVVVGAMAGGP
jgi:hypothetical protein